MKLEELKRVNLVTLLSEAWGMSFRPEGCSFVALSPFRTECTASFYVSVGDDGHWVYCDHGDGSSGSIIDLMMRRNNATDFASARRAAEDLVGASVLPAGAPAEAAEPQPSKEWDWLHDQLCRQDSGPCLDYLVGRGLDVGLVTGLIEAGVITLNCYDASRYCCFAVRDGSGKLRSLSNRLIDGASEREKFLLGSHCAFCLDWSALAVAETVHVCESIIDALSIVTLDATACVVAFAGAHGDVSGLPLARGALLVDAFDADDAGRAAAARLQQQYTHRVERFALHGFADVNDYLQNRPRTSTRTKLSAEQRLSICLDERSSREVAAQYGVHHSYVCSIRQEAAAVLRDHWQNKKVGRKAAPAPVIDGAALDKELADQTRRVDLLSMRNDWLKLQLTFHEQRDAEAEKEVRAKKRKKKSPAEIGQMLEMISTHEQRFGQYTQIERLAQVDLTVAGYGRLKYARSERTRRESLIMEDEVSAAIDLIVAHPHLGAGKLRLTLIDQEKAMISTGFLNEAKMLIAQQSEELYRERAEAARTLEAALREHEAQREPYRHIEPKCPHDIWAVDFVFIAFLGYRLTLCVVYDIFTQGYMSIVCGSGCTEDLAREALERSVASLGQRPCSYLRRDNGKAFVTASVQAFLASYAITDQPIPPGQPWFNGSLESNNGNLKSTIKATALQLAAAEPNTVGQGRRSIDEACALLQEVCEKTRRVLNVEISRPKFRMPPQTVLDGKVAETQARHDQFTRRKTAERAARMAGLRARAARPRNRTFLDKVRDGVRRKARDLSTNALFALNEIIHGRYAAIET